MDFKEQKNFIIILVIVLAVALVIIYSTTGLFKKVQVVSPEEAEIRKIQTQSSSDQIEAIEADLKATDLSDIDRELQEIEKELEQAY